VISIWQAKPARRRLGIIGAGAARIIVHRSTAAAYSLIVWGAPRPHPAALAVLALTCASCTAAVRARRGLPSFGYVKLDSVMVLAPAFTTASKGQTDLGNIAHRHHTELSTRYLISPVASLVVVNLLREMLKLGSGCPFQPALGLIVSITFWLLDCYQIPPASFRPSVCTPIVHRPISGVR